jgi:hypothetical protein
LALRPGWRYIEVCRKLQQGLEGNFRSQTYTDAERWWRFIGGSYIVGRLHLLPSWGFFCRDKLLESVKSSNVKALNKYDGNFGGGDVSLVTNC